MTIKKYLGKTREEALEAARNELGANMVVMNVKEIRGQGPLAIFQGRSFEVTAAVEDDSPTPSYMEVVESARNTQAEGMRRFDAIADERIPIQQRETAPEPVFRPIERPAQTPKDGDNEAILADKEDELRSAFRAVGEVVEHANVNGRLARSAVSAYDRNATIIKYQDPASSTEYTRDLKPHRPRRREEDVVYDEKLSDNSSVQKRSAEPVVSTSGSLNPIVKAIYQMLLDHEVDEKYINQVMADLDLDSMEGNVETALNLVYQKLVLKFGPIRPIELKEKRPKVVFFVGPTGVGKTTTIAKIASEFKLNRKQKVALFTADTYRIAAEKQLSVYGELMQIDVVVLYEADDINEKIAKKYSKFDLILVDTTGFSHKDEEQRQSIENLLGSLKDRYDKQVYLVLSATTKYRDLKDIVDAYRQFTDFDLIFTKLDETDVHGNVLNIRLYADTPLSYVTTGQSVPSDIEIIDTQKMVRGLLGGA